MHRNAYQGGEIRKSMPPPDGAVDACVFLLFCLIPIITIVVAIWRTH